MYTYRYHYYSSYLSTYVHEDLSLVRHVPKFKVQDDTPPNLKIKSRELRVSMPVAGSRVAAGRIILAGMRLHVHVLDLVGLRNYSGGK